MILATGECLDNDEVKVPTYPVRVVSEVIPWLRNRVSPIILRVNAKILERNPVSGLKSNSLEQVSVANIFRFDISHWGMFGQ